MSVENNEKTTAEGGVTGAGFKPGKSGNPGGRPKVPEDVRTALVAACPDAVKLLVDTVNNKKAKPALRVACANAVIDRVYGKSKQIVEFDNGQLNVVIEYV